MNTPSVPHAPEPWWKHGHMWMVVGGPAIVVVASFVTLYLAIRTPDPVYSDPPGGHVAAEEEKSELMPAMQARNHAATGGVAPKADAASAPADARR